MACVQFSPPYGLPRRTECRKRFRLLAESGLLTRDDQPAGREGGSPGHNRGLPSRHAARRAVMPMGNGTGTQLVSTLERFTRAWHII